MIRNFFLTFFYLLICFFSAELYLRIYFPQNLSSPWRIYMDDGLLLNKKNGRAFHNFKTEEIDEDTGEVKEVKYKAEYNFGKYHNRKYDLNESDDKILILGDSNPFGWLLDDEETYIYKIAKNFKNYEFINSSAGGHGISDQLNFFIKFCEKIKPKYTFVLINADVIKRSKISNLFYLDENNNLKAGKNKIPKIVKFTENNIVYEFLVSYSHTINFIRRAYVLYSINKNSNNSTIDNEDINSENNTKLNEKYIFEKKLFKKFQNHASKCKSNLNFINIAWNNPKTYVSSTYEFLDNNIDFLNKEKINYVTISEKMNLIYANPEKYSIEGDGHPNEKAHKIYANILIKEFNKILD